MLYTDYIELNADIMLGQPVIKGTRITVSLVLEKLSQGASVQQLIASYPDLSDATINAVLAYASEAISKESTRVDRMLENLNSLHELGRQRCFELGNPFYFKDAMDRNEPGNEKGNYYRKELSSGELYLVSLEVNTELADSFSIKDTVIRKIS